MPLLVMAQEARWITGKGMVVAANISPEKAKQQALERARQNALEQMEIGIESQIQMIRGENKEQIFDNFIEFSRSTVRGKIVEEKIVKWNNYFLEDGTPVYEVTLQAKVVSELGKPDPGFQLRLQLNQTTYRDGEEMVITVRSTRDAYLYIFNWLEGDTVVMLFPNPYFQDNFLPADSLFVFPPPDMQHLLALEVNLPSNRTETQELIMAVAVRKKIRFPAAISNSSGLAYLPTLRSALLELNKWLLNFKLSERVENAQLYRIVK